MQITEVRIKLMNPRNDKLRAFCSVTLDNEVVIRDLKVIEGAKGLFVAMPSRKLADRCPRCKSKNHLRASFCNECGANLPEDRASRDERGRAKLHVDVAHPINAVSRETLQHAVMQAYQEEAERSKQPGYRPAALVETEDETYEEEFDYADGTPTPGSRSGPSAGPASN